MKNQTVACESCPWRVVNHGKRQTDRPGWYSAANRRRLWRGLTNGEAPGMTCHATDERTGAAKPGAEMHECAGALLLVKRELQLVETEQADYKKRFNRRLHFTRAGLAYWMERMLMGPGIPDIGEDNGVGLGL